MVIDYNKYMGDLPDALAKINLPTMKTTKMWTKLLMSMLQRMTNK